MGNLHGAQLEAFISEGQRNAVIATVTPEGRPHCVPVWFVLDRGEVVFSTGRTSVKAANLRANPHIAVLIDKPDAPITFARVEGTVEYVEELGEFHRLLRAIYTRYGENYGDDGDPETTVIVRVKAVKMTGTRYD